MSAAVDPRIVWENGGSTHGTDECAERPRRPTRRQFAQGADQLTLCDLSGLYWTDSALMPSSIRRISESLTGVG